MAFGVFGGEGSYTQKFDKGMTKAADKGHDRLKKGIDKIKGAGAGDTLSITFEKGSFRRVDNGELYNFQFNPTTIKDSRSANVPVSHPIQSEQADYQHVNYGERTITFQLFLNGLENREGRSTSIKAPIPFDNKFGILSRPLKQAYEGAITVAAKRIPYAQGVGTAMGVLKRLFGKEYTEQEREPTRNVLADVEQLDEYLRGFGDLPAPKLEFDWPGYDRSDWICVGLDFNTTMWDRKKFPLHVTADLTLKEIKRRTRTQQSNAIFSGARVTGIKSLFGRTA